MIIDAIMNILTAPVKLALNLIPTIDIELPPNVMVACADYLELAGYFLPLDTICIVLSLLVVMWMTRITMAVLVRAKSFVPTMGS